MEHHTKSRGTVVIQQRMTASTLGSCLDYIIYVYDYESAIKQNVSWRLLPHLSFFLHPEGSLVHLQKNHFGKRHLNLAEMKIRNNEPDSVFWSTSGKWMS